MKRTKIVFTILVLSGLSLTGLRAQTVTANKLWASPDLLTTCESVYHDAREKCLFVSCINGNPLDKDGNGFIAKVNLNGSIITLKWATGLNAPKGMGIAGDYLYVTDIDCVIKISLKDGSISKEFPVENAKFLNDIAVSDNENIYISDYSTNKIYVIEDGHLSLWSDSDLLKGPNGLLCERNDLFIGTNNGIFSGDFDEKQLSKIIAVSGGIDGLQADGKGNFIISDWKGKVQLVSEHAGPVVIFDTSDKGINAADLWYDASSGILYVPTFGDNRVMAYQLTYH